MVQRNDLTGGLSDFSKSGISKNKSQLSPKALARRRNVALLSLAAASVALSATAGKSKGAITGFGNESISFGGSNNTLTLQTGNTTSIASANSFAITSAMTAASHAGGGTVTIPSGTYFSSFITIRSTMNNVDLVLAANAVLTDNNPTNILINSSATNAALINNFEITGSGAINGGATGTVSGNKLIQITNATNLLFKGITIENASQEHFAPEQDTNVTIDGININDNGTLSGNGGNYLGNTDGLDYDGNNFLIINSSFQDGDDDIVSKTNTNGTHGVLIQNDYIGAGHGIGVGGGFQGGIDNYTVNNVTFNGTTTGLRIKASDFSSSSTGGGPTHPASATYENITMTNVQMPIEFDSFYTSGENLPNSPIPGVSVGNTFSSTNANKDQYPTGGVTFDSKTPFFTNVLFKNITSTDSQIGSAAGDIFGSANSSVGNFNVNNITFYNVNLTANRQLDIWYSGGLTFAGLVVNDLTTNSNVNTLNTGPTNIAGVWYYGDQIIASVPEPTSMALALPALAGLASSRLVGRKRRRQDA